MTMVSVSQGFRYRYHDGVLSPLTGSGDTSTSLCLFFADEIGKFGRVFVSLSRLLRERDAAVSFVGVLCASRREGKGELV